jgi:all-trans-retinol 13,14-reductase
MKPDMDKSEVTGPKWDAIVIGSGIGSMTAAAPFLPMFAALREADQLGSAELLFGCRLAEEDFTKSLSPLPYTTVCLSGSGSSLVEGDRDTEQGTFRGHVTERLSGTAYDPSRTDFYLCGSPAMVQECQGILSRAGVTDIFTEPY